MANITRYNPYGELVTLRDAMGRLFEDSFVSPLTWRQLDGEMLNPAIDVHQTVDEIIVSAALPGVKAEDVDITITGQTLSVRGEFKADEKVERDQYLYRERRYGTFHRQVELPVRVQGDATTATFEDGVLTLRIPKAEEVKPRQIKVKPATAQ
jgi:Molecular chaperone (small heat shock protein)